MSQGITVAEVPAYIRALTPVILRGDTRVTNYGFAGGRPTARQSVLQAGTAVLVDQFGEPQAKCNCGNPLNAPQAVATAPRYTGPKWPGFTPGGITVVVKNTTVINVITVIDVTTGTPFGRPTGPNAGPDRPLPGAPAPATTAPPTTAPPSGGQPGGDCPGFTGTLLQTLLLDTASGAQYATPSFQPGRCLRFVFSGEADLDINKGGSGGWDPIWCYDPDYCPTPKAEMFLMPGGYTIWQVFGLTTPPPLAADHRYEFRIKTETAGPVAFQLYDRAEDNRGTFKIEVYA